MPFWKKTPENSALSEEMKAERRIWAGRLTSIQIRTLRSSRPPRATRALSVRQQLIELTESYRDFLDAQRPDGMASLARGWTGGLQSWTAIQQRAEEIIQVFSRSPEDRADRVLDLELLRRIRYVSLALIRGFRSHAGAELGANTLPIADGSAAHWAANFRWNNEVLLVNGDSTLGIPSELWPAGVARTSVLPPLEFDRSTLDALETAVDLDLDHIAMQTTITMNGDVTNRVAPQLAPEERAALLEIHQKGVEVALVHWTGLINAVTAFVERLLGLLFRPAPK